MCLASPQQKNRKWLNVVTSPLKSTAKIYSMSKIFTFPLTSSYFFITRLKFLLMQFKSPSNHGWRDVLLSCQCIIKDKPPTVCVFWLRPTRTAASNRWDCHTANNTSGSGSRKELPFFIIYLSLLKKKKEKKKMHLQHINRRWRRTTSGPPARRQTTMFLFLSSCMIISWPKKKKKNSGESSFG